MFPVADHKFKKGICINCGIKLESIMIELPSGDIVFLEGSDFCPGKKAPAEAGAE